MKIMILEIDGDRVEFSTRTEGGEVSLYSTNSRGEGLWECDETGTRARQISGTCQFSLLNVSRSTMHRRIRARLDYAADA